MIDAADLASGDQLVAVRRGPVAHVVFNNPARHNAVSLEMWERMAVVLDELAADPDVRVLVVSGAGGKAFVSGADVSRFESERSSAEGVARYNAAAEAAYESLGRFPRPTVAAIEGFCLGGGVNLAVCCDLRVCSPGATFGVPAARLGLGYGLGNVRRLAAVVGLPDAVDLLVTARRIDAAEALRIGLVSRVAAEGGLAAATEAVTDAIVANAPLTIAAVKAAAVELRRPPAERDAARVAALVAACFTSQDYVEGRTAFMEKRPPDFRGT